MSRGNCVRGLTLARPRKSPVLPTICNMNLTLGQPMLNNLLSDMKQTYRIVVSTNTCYYSENQVFGGVTIRVLCSKRGCY